MLSKPYYIFVSLVLLLFCIIQSTHAQPHMLARRDDFDSLVSELRSKGSRMRFGKRSAMNFEQQPSKFIYYFAIPSDEAIPMMS
uniref:Uncharacterized protein n=1 Tax=Panagrolaimus sp. JU765 TaxID=591449 RepID=A0AC34QS68_9BILA